MKFEFDIPDVPERRKTCPFNKFKNWNLTHGHRDVQVYGLRATSGSCLVDKGQPKRACLTGRLCRLYQHSLSARLESDLLVFKPFLSHVGFSGPKTNKLSPFLRL
jgi:hypothetical protein